ncbi:MAG: hypothetical protein QOG44_2438 [Acidimicrobiaceae bacterium]|jgi:hypothetical protein|nr:hypothetical protein [Acidimicrobiaceae bacterium]
MPPTVSERVRGPDQNLKAAVVVVACGRLVLVLLAAAGEDRLVAVGPTVVVVVEVADAEQPRVAPSVSTVSSVSSVSSRPRPSAGVRRSVG